MQTHIRPQHKLAQFNCPHCKAIAPQHWPHYVGYAGQHGQLVQISSLSVAKCSHCADLSLWFQGELFYPEDVAANIDPANSDLRQDIQEDYIEASRIVKESPRGAAALLRLCVQKLCGQLGENESDVNTAIGNLVKKNLPVEIQQALDIVRVIGNNAVHPGQIDLKDNTETAMRLFELTNIIADNRITQPQKIAELYKSLPETSRDQIEKRDQRE
ncbi:MAG: DUF4145 domain-containing protein [bacterium]|nr:DUF4145 domain-containing protein [bacterium]